MLYCRPVTFQCLIQWQDNGVGALGVVGGWVVRGIPHSVKDTVRNLLMEHANASMYNVIWEHILKCRVEKVFIPLVSKDT